MNEPVAVPVEHSVETPKKVYSKTPEGQVLDEGLSLDSYRGTHQVPYVVDYFGVKDLYNTNTDVNRMVDDITQYLIDKTPGESMVFVVKQILDTLHQELNLKNEDAPLYKVKRVHKMIGIKKHLDMVEQMKKQALEDIENML